MANSLQPIFTSLKQAQAKLAAENRASKDKALLSAADAIDRDRAAILKANALAVEQ